MKQFTQLLRDAQHLADQAKQAATTAGDELSRAYEAAAPHVQDFAKQASKAAEEAYSATEQHVHEATRVLQQHVENLAGEPPAGLTLDEVGRRIASLGPPALAFAVAASSAAGMG